MIDIEFALQEKEYRLAMASGRSYFRRPLSLTRRACLSTLLIALAILKWKPWPGIDYLMLLQALCAAWFFHYGVVEDRQLKAAFVRLGRGQEHWRLDQDGLSVVQDSSTAHFSWSTFGRWRETKVFILLHSKINPESLQILPKRAVPRETLEEMRTLFRDHIDPPSLHHH